MRNISEIMDTMNIPEAVYKMADGRLYDVKKAAFIPESELSGREAIELGGGQDADLKASLVHYRTMWPEIEIPDFLMDAAEKIAAIDAATSAKILAGFDYAVNGQTLHFGYDSFDQQNFADTANACLMKKAGAPGLPESVTWNAYAANGALKRLTLTADEFLTLYAAGALAHKAACMEEGGKLKEAAVAGQV